MKTTLLFLLFAAFYTTWSFSSLGSTLPKKIKKGSDRQQIIESVKKEIPSDVIVKSFGGPYIFENYAMLSTVYLEGGGESLLKKENGTWKIVFEGGGSFGEAGMIDYGGFPPNVAKEIMRQAELDWRRKRKVLK